MISGSWDRTIKLWRIEDSVLLKILENVHNADIFEIVLAKDGLKFYTAGFDKNINIWN